MRSTTIGNNRLAQRPSLPPLGVLMKRSNFCSAISTLAFTLISLTSVVSGVSEARAPVQASNDAIADSLVANWIAAPSCADGGCGSRADTGAVSPTRTLLHIVGVGP